MTEEVLEQQSKISLGEQLEKARRQGGISVAEMADKLKLTENQITALESDDYSLLGPVTFVKGHIRSYCREFALSEEQLMRLFSHQREEDEKRMQSFSRRTEREAKDNHLMLFSYAIVALILGSSLFIWWQNREPVNNEAAQPESNEVPVVARQNVQHSVSSVNLAPVSEQQTQSETVEAEVQEKPNSEPQAVLEQAPQAVQAQTVASNPKNKVEKQLDTLVMTFNGDSWVEIFDADGERVAFGVKKKGYVMTVEGKAPFNVVLGKHYIVDVAFNDSLVDLSHFPTNRLAKFNLPLSE